MGLVSEALFDLPAKLIQLRRASHRSAEQGADSALFLHQQVAEDMAERLHVFRQNFNHVTIFRDVGFDWAQALALKAERGAVQILPAPLSVQDFPLQPQSQDLIIAPLWLHWVNDLPQMLMALRFALKPGGLLIGAMFGGESLIELKRCLAEAEDRLRGGVHPRTSPSVDLRTLAGLMQSAGFSVPVVDGDRMPLQYASALKLLKDLSDSGEGNALTARSRAPMSRGLMFDTVQLYHQRFADADTGLIPVTCDVLHFSGSAPQEVTTGQ